MIFSIDTLSRIFIKPLPGWDQNHEEALKLFRIDVFNNGDSGSETKKGWSFPLLGYEDDAFNRLYIRHGVTLRVYHTL